MTAPKRKGGRPRSMKVTAKKKMAAPKKIEGTYCIQYGTPNELGQVHVLKHEAKAREMLRKVVEDRKAWCERYNSAGLAVITEALEWMANTPFTHNKADRVFCIDEMYQVKIRLTYWTTEPKEGSK